MHKMILQKHGTIDLNIVESNPVIFHGKLYRYEYVRRLPQNAPEKFRRNQREWSHSRFVNMETGEPSVPFADRLGLSNAFVWENRIYVMGNRGGASSQFYQTESDDMIHWTEPHVILENPRWEGYNTTVCRAGDHFILAFELGAPLDIVKVPFTMFFAESADLTHWKVIPDAVFGADIYTGGPMLRYFDGWFYFFYVDGSYEKGFTNCVARSRDLKNWTWSRQNPVLMFNDAEDKKIHGDFTPEEVKYIQQAEDSNNSDMDMCEWNGALYITYSWGNQRGTEFLAEAEANCGEQEFCEGFFR